MKRISATIIGISIGLSTFAQESDSLNFEVKRYDFQQTTPKVVIEHLILDSIENLGRVDGSYVGASYLRDDDLVYLKLKNPAVSVGDRFMLYSDEGPVPVPGVHGKKVGRDILIKGFVEVAKVLPQAVVGKIYNAAMNITVGDLIATPIEQNIVLTPQEPARQIRGQVLRSSKHLGLIAPFDFVYLNRGEKDGLRINDRLFVYHTAEGSRLLDPNRPPVNIAELVVVNMGEHVSTAYVLGAETSFDEGTPFKSAISDVKFLSNTASRDLQNSMSAPATQTEEKPTSDEAVDAEDDFNFMPNSSYLQFGPGIFMRVSKNGMHRPYFSFFGEYGTGNWAVPLTYGVISANEQTLKTALRYQFEFYPLASIRKLNLWVGGGPVVDYSFNTQTGAQYDSFQLGLEASAEFRYLFAPKLFASFAPAVIDGFIWDYISTSATSNSKIDIAGRWSMQAAIGYTF